MENMENQSFFQVTTAGLGKYHMDGYPPGSGVGGYSALNLPGCVSMKVMDIGLFLAPCE